MGLARIRQVPRQHQWKRTAGEVMTSNPPWEPWRCFQCGMERHFLHPGPATFPRPYMNDIGPCDGVVPDNG